MCEVSLIKNLLFCVVGMWPYFNKFGNGISSLFKVTISITIQRCSIENQKGAVTIDFVQCPSGSQWNIVEYW